MYSIVLYGGRNPPDCESGIEPSFIPCIPRLKIYFTRLGLASNRVRAARFEAAPDKASTACSHNISAKCLSIKVFLRTLNLYFVAGALGRIAAKRFPFLTVLDFGVSSLSQTLTHYLRFLSLTHKTFINLSRISPTEATASNCALLWVP